MIKHLEAINSQHLKPEICFRKGVHPSNSANVLHLTVQLANWMDKSEWVAEYGLFGCMKQPADNFVSLTVQLVNYDGSFTDLMWIHMSDQPLHTSPLSIEGYWKWS
jgi:hypothetical protein